MVFNNNLLGQPRIVFEATYICELNKEKSLNVMLQRTDMENTSCQVKTAI